MLNTVPPPPSSAALLVKGAASTVSAPLAAGGARLPPAAYGDYIVRRTAVDHAIPLVTNVQLVALLAAALARHARDPLVGLSPESLFEHYRAEAPKDAWTSPSEFH